MRNIHDWRVINLPDTSKNIFDRGRKITELESVAAAVHRCEAVLQTAEPDTEKLVIYRSSNQPQSIRYDHSLLLKLMKAERSLSRYLDASENDPVLAFAYAKGDVAYLNQLRTSAILAFSVKAFLSKALMPILLIVWTAALGNVVGTALQKQAFERNRTFEFKLERLRESQRIAGNLVLSLLDIQQKVQRDEKRNELNWRPQDYLRESRRYLYQIRDTAAGIEDKESFADIDNALSVANGHLNHYIECLESNTDDTGITSTKGITCSEQFSIKPFIDLQDAVSRALVKFLS